MVATPENPVAGLNKTFVPLMVAVPLVGLTLTRLRLPCTKFKTSLVRGLNTLLVVLPAIL